MKVISSLWPVWTASSHTRYLNHKEPLSYEWIHQCCNTQMHITGSFYNKTLPYTQQFCPPQLFTSTSICKSDVWVVFDWMF